MGGRSARFANQSLMIRLSLHGCTNRPFYHIVVNRAYRARDATPIAQIGTYDPMPNAHNEKMISINFEKLHQWIKKGAQPSKHVATLLGLNGFYPLHPMTEINARRNRLRAAEASQPASEDEGTAV